MSFAVFCRKKWYCVNVLNSVFTEVQPAKRHKHSRQPGLSLLQAFGMMKNNISDEPGAWEFARSSRAWVGAAFRRSWLIKIQQSIDKVVSSRTSQENAQLRLRGRLGIFDDTAQRTCECAPQGAGTSWPKRNLPGTTWMVCSSVLSTGFCCRASRSRKMSSL